MNENPPSPSEEISDADWAQTPESVKRFVLNLAGRVEQLAQQYTELKAENALLREQVKQDSQNSSQPPSQDIGKGFKPKEKKDKGKPRGAQFGHEGHLQTFYPVEECKTVEDYYPEQCLSCGGKLHGSDPEPHRVQQVEIPVVKPIVHEHRFHRLRCERCGAMTRAWDDGIINGNRYGERVVAHVGVLSGQYRQSHRMVQDLLRDFFGIEICVGQLNRLRQESSAVVAEAVKEAQQYVQQQAQVNMDETSFGQGNTDGNNPSRRKGWLWVMVTPLVSYFAIALSRSSQVCQQLLGEAFSGIVGSDRCGAYTGLDLAQRQVCWAHLKRDFTKIAEREGIAGSLGKALLEQQRLLFKLWYRVRDGTLDHCEFAEAVQPIRDQVHQLLTQGAGYAIAPKENTPLAKTVRTCQQLLKVEAAFWTFVTTQGIEPTNNAAERALRPAVLWRKNSFGSQSAEGSLFVSRMLTVVTSLRSQDRSVLEFLTLSCRASRQGQIPPSLLPIQDSTP